MTRPLITVYITNYNYGQYIREAITGLLNQTFQNFEVIIIDDGSTDNSKEIIEEYASHEKIQIIYQQNKGLNVTNNVAIKASKGKYIMRLDADDFLTPDALEVMSTKLESDENLGLVFPDYYMVDKEGNILNIEQRHSFNDEVSLFDQPAHGACTMIRTDFLKNLGGYDEQYTCQDGYELWIKFVTKYKVANVNKPLFYYRQHGKNLTSNEDKILRTRQLIKDNYIQKHIQTFPNTITIIPVRDTNTIAFEKIEGTYLLDIAIQNALKSEKTGTIIISSPDSAIKRHIEHSYTKTERIIFHEREKSLSRLDQTLDSTVLSILNDARFSHLNPEFALIISPEFPLVKHTSYEDAIHTMLIFKSDSLISVRGEKGLFYRHDGSGMKPILHQDKFTKLEREALFRNVGGITSCNVAHFKSTKKIISGKVGHIEVTQKEAMHANTSFNLDIIAHLYNQKN
ncbi:MAG: glycosyltransferase [Bacteroidales bacterium]|jgi:CMP-N-acetylneuraminic acid synthetase|nr:glycosyltransferase [Bacteroidales bacterium]